MTDKSRKSPYITPLTDKAETFCVAYAHDMDMKRAEITSGYKRGQGKELLAQPAVVMRVQELRAAKLERINADKDYVAKRLMEIDEMDVLDILDDNGEFLPVKRWPKVWRTSITSMKTRKIGTGGDLGIEVEVKWPDKLKNLELLGKHIDVSAWEERRKTLETEAPALSIEFNVRPANRDVVVTRGGSE